MKCFLLILVSTTLFSSLVANNGDFRFPVQVKVEQGILEGSYDTKTGLQSYLGVPFAQPPVGELRWKAPRGPNHWEGVRPAKKFGPRAMQAPFDDDMIFESDGISEDCLYLNVWTPVKRGTVGLPVLVYFYGGGLVAGDGSEPRYNGASMAAEGIVAVTANYRLNIFGFLAHPELSAESPYNASGNYGLLDQQAVLAWVQKNIAAFGGDPKRVTIAGESAGSVSVSYQMASPLSKNLIAGAIGESGAGIAPTLSPVPLAKAERIGKDFLTKAGVPSIAAAKKLSARDIYEIYNASRRFGFPPVVDGYFLMKTLPEVFAAHEQAQVPLLVGWNSAEVSGLDFMQGKTYEDAAYVERMKETYPTNFEEILKLYPHGSPQEIEISATALASDRFIAFATWHWFDLHRKNSDEPVYRYLFRKQRPLLNGPTLRANLAVRGLEKEPAKEPAAKALGAPHASEIEYCLGNLPLTSDYTWTDDDYKVSQTMQTYFANFIKAGNPNSAGLPEWPASRADDQSPPVMVIDIQTRVQRAENDDRYRLLQAIYDK